MRNTEAAQNTTFYQILKEEAKRSISLHEKMVKAFKAETHNRAIQRDLQVSKLYVSAYLTLLNKCKEKSLSHSPKNLTLLCSMISFVDQIEERIYQYTEDATQEISVSKTLAQV